MIFHRAPLSAGHGHQRQQHHRPGGTYPADGKGQDGPGVEAEKAGAEAKNTSTAAARLNRVVTPLNRPRVVPTFPCSARSMEMGVVQGHEEMHP